MKAVYFALGPEYFDCARGAVMSLRRVHPHMRACVHVLNSEPRDFGVPGVELIHHEFPGNRPLREFARIKRIEALATDNEIAWYSDSDSMVKREIDVGFKMLADGEEILMSHARGHPMRIAYFRKEYPEVAEALHPNTQVFATGCIFQRPTSRVRDLWERILKYYLEKPIFDMPAIARAICDPGSIIPTPLVHDEWMQEYPGNGRSRVVQFYGSGKLAQMTEKGVVT